MRAKAGARTSFAEFCWWPCCGPPGVREQFDFPATAACSVRVVVKELAKANASDWLWQIRVALGRSNSFQTSTEYPPTRKSPLVLGFKIISVLAS